MARRRGGAPHQSGFLNIDKPPGWTSHDVVNAVRRVTGERRVGHAGTLDPAATGVLPIAVGHATRLLPWLEDADKTYLAVVQLGVETDSGDRDGRVVVQKPVAHLSEESMREAAERFTGVIQQTPPMHSAIRVDGQRLYDAVRTGRQVEVPVREVKVYRCDVVSWEPPRVELFVQCSKGTYIRSLARDIGRAVDSAAMLRSLVRIRAGQFHISSSIPLDTLAQGLDRDGWESVALHPDTALSGCPLVVLGADEARDWFHGKPIARAGLAGHVSVYNSDGIWIGVGTGDAAAGVMRPMRVIGTNDA